MNLQCHSFHLWFAICFSILIIRSTCAQDVDVLINKIDNIDNNDRYNDNNNNIMIYSYPTASIILQLHQDSMVGIDRVQSRRLKSMGNVSISDIKPIYDKLKSDQIAPVFEGLGMMFVIHS